MHGRERIAALLGEVVHQARVVLDDHGAEGEAPNVLMFYVLADHLSASAVSVEAALGPAGLAGGLRQLRARCRGDLSRFGPAVEQALHEAEMLDWEYRTA